MRTSKQFITSTVVLLVWPVAAWAAPLGPEEAASHVGESTTVCGLVASATHAARSRGAPTFLNLGKPYPDQIFTAVIWGDDRVVSQFECGGPCPSVQDLMMSPIGGRH